MQCHIPTDLSLFCRRNISLEARKSKLEADQVTHAHVGIVLVQIAGGDMRQSCAIQLKEALVPENSSCACHAPKKMIFVFC